MANSYRTEAPKILLDFLAYHETIKAHSQRTVDEYFLDMRNFFLPILRADYNLVETYIHRNRNISFDCDIHVLYGKRDHIDKNSLIEWKKYTNKDFHIKGFDGGHMFFRDNFYETTDYINQTVAHIS